MIKMSMQPSGQKKPLLRIAIDGPVAAGKGTLARLLANRFHLIHIETGLMYRAIAYKVLTEGIREDQSQALAKLAMNTRFQFRTVRIDNIARTLMLVDDNDITSYLMSPSVDLTVPVIAQHSELRSIIHNKQKELSQIARVIMDGKDIGSRIMHNASVKVFLTADFDVRVDRRLAQHHQRGYHISRSTVAEQIRRRDSLDFSRQIDALIVPEGAHWVDNSLLSEQETLEIVSEIIENSRAKLA